MKAKPFYFKQFTIHQDRCALKVGTDGVLLGAWTDCSGAKSILDIGSGTGVISLMLAQRSAANINAIEIDKDAAEQCAENFQNSNWKERLEVIHSSVQDYTDTELIEKFDLIASNPPFYSIQKEINRRSTARSEQELNLQQLIDCVAKVLAASGKFNIIYPYDRKSELMKVCASYHLFPSKICYVKGTVDSKIKRILVEFAYGKQTVIESQLTIELQRHEYTEEYRDLCKDYLTIF